MRQDVLIDLENYINSKNQEFQALGDQIRVYLNNGGEITLTVTNSTITVLTYNIENSKSKYICSNVKETIMLLDNFIS
ncbi:MAG: hypothetical protein H8E55_16355 [Pelagibacterales bacterium]|nr:hypothetical protein [Pelagibacterales bacterium]|tara:strand:- start:245 stop:478 length:234 start_codon:yes stop_codon:yes gene_type:complete